MYHQHATDMSLIQFTEIQGHGVQRDTKAKKYPTSIVGTLR